jgi:hypothetical protein
VIFSKNVFYRKAVAFFSRIQKNYLNLKKYLVLTKVHKIVEKKWESFAVKDVFRKNHRKIKSLINCSVPESGQNYFENILNTFNP